MSCQDYKDGKINEEILQELIRNDALQVASLEESSYREFLLQKEEEIELIMYTKDENEIRPQILGILPEVEARTRNRLQSTSWL